MSQHGGQHMMSPSGKLPHLVVRHSQIQFGFLKTLFDGPANSREPDKGFQAGGSAGVRDKVGEVGIFPGSSRDERQLLLPVNDNYNSRF